MAEEEKKTQTAADEPQNQEDLAEKEAAHQETEMDQEPKQEEKEAAQEEKQDEGDPKVKALTDQLMRLQADFSNYKKRTSRE